LEFIEFYSLLIHVWTPLLVLKHTPRRNLML